MAASALDALTGGCCTESMIAFLRRRHGLVSLIGALLLPPALCAVLIPSRTSLPNTDAALGLVALVAAIAVLGGRRAGWFAAAGTALWFDFFLTVPYERFAVANRDDIQTTVLIPRLQPDGTVVHSGKAVWGMDQFGFPNEKVELLARRAGNAIALTE